MLNSNSRDFLDSISCEEPETFMSYFTFDEAVEISGFSKSDLMSIVSHLVAHGYLEYDPESSGNFRRFALTEKGKNREEFFMLEAKEFVLKSFLTPIVVSIVTTLLTLQIVSLLQK